MSRPPCPLAGLRYVNRRNGGRGERKKNPLRCAKEKKKKKRKREKEGEMICAHGGNRDAYNFDFVLLHHIPSTQPTLCCIEGMEGRKEEEEKKKEKKNLKLGGEGGKGGGEKERRKGGARSAAARARYNPREFLLSEIFA